MNRILWLLYTLGVGLIPFILRAMSWVNLTDTIPFDIEYILNPIDFSTLAIVLSCANFLEMENLKKVDKKYKIFSQAERYCYPAITLISVLVVVSMLNGLYAEECNLFTSLKNITDLESNHNFSTIVNSRKYNYLRFFVIFGMCISLSVLSYLTVRKKDLAIISKTKKVNK